MRKGPGRAIRQVEHIHDQLWHRYSIAVNQKSSAVWGKTGTLSTCSYGDANIPYLYRRRLVPNFRSIRDRYTIRYPALYILHNKTRYKMVWHQFETITPGTEKWRRSNVNLLIYIHHYKEVHEIQNFPFISSNIPAASAYGIYISQLIIYCRACGCYRDFHDRGLLLTLKLMNHGYPVVKLMSSLQRFEDHHHDLVNR
jgi:hypothetical protein